jgi:ABC-type multidrug transport system ATPase subunit
MLIDAMETSGSDLVIMDEVTNGLDVSTVLKLENMIGELPKNSNVILTGHDLNFYQKIASNFLIIKDQDITIVNKGTGDNWLENVYKENYGTD